MMQTLIFLTEHYFVKLVSRGNPLIIPAASLTTILDLAMSV